jgi:hypothetical protein
MTGVAHKPGIHEKYLVKRRLKLAETVSTPEAALLAALDAAPGVAEVGLDREKRRLSLAYDASTQSLDGLIAVLQKQGVALATDWWSRFRAGWYRNLDANIHDNARHEPWSCHGNLPK